MLYGLTQPHIFKGHYDLCVLRGAVSVGGIVLAASKKPVKISSPAPPYFSIKPHFTADTADFVPQTEENDQKFAGTSCVIEIQPLELAHLAALAPPFKSLFEPLAHLSNETDTSQLWNPLPGWQEAVSLQQGESLVLVGPKNSGKSALARFALNLANVPDLYLVDLDPGQCELSPPGTMSLARVQGKDFSAPYLRASFEGLIKAHTLGYVSPMACPNRYMELAIDLFDSIPAGATVVVNTPGWTKGLGLELVCAILQCLRPTKAVHMGRDESYESLQEQLQPALYLTVCEPVVSTSLAKFSASDMRNLQTVAYFHKNNPQHITQWAPYELELDPSNTTGSAVQALALFEPYGIDPSDFELCFEGALVAINQLTDRVANVDGVVSSPELLHTSSRCIGYGVVQRFKGRSIRLLTPLDPDTIDGPIVLARGRLDLPIFLAWDGQQEGPWLIAKNPPGVGSVYTKFRRNIGRN